MEIKEHYNLSKANTFGLEAKALFFVEIQSEADLAELFALPEFRQNKKLFLGGGSNVLLTEDFDGIVVLNMLKGIEVVEENPDGNSVSIRAMGGEVWHDLVTFAVDRGYWGIENLSLIPGTVGAAPMQNIGAYGAELKKVLETVEAFDVETGAKRIFSKEECELGYRDSIFKNRLKGKYFISAVTLRLSKKENKNLEYKILSDYLTQNKIEIAGPKDVSDAVSAIRRSKLPDPKLLGNAGSFFKNVFVTKSQLQKLRAEYPGMPHFEEGGAVKIPAGWLIEQCGWKGKRVGNVGVHEKQALVLVNYGGATGAEILDLARSVIDSVKEKFGLDLVPEVNIV
jgi:UDP-N-acetylmuramate dehydrogenase